MRASLAKLFSALVLLTAWASPAPSAEQPPWGRAEPAPQVEHAPQKVVYDHFRGGEEDLESILDRVSFLNQLYGADPFEASIVVVVHGPALDRFALDHFAENRALMERAESLTQSGPIDFRICQAAASMRGFEPEDFHGFVRMVPMADSEIIRLQQEEGHAYMQ